MGFSFSVNRPSIVSILLNDRCNLQCNHCYLEHFRERNILTEVEWEKMFHSLFSDLRPQKVVFAGKEVFVDRQSVHLLAKACAMRDQLQQNFDHKTRIGVITNGTLVHHYKKELHNMTLDWMDISIDGAKEYHNAIRGEGAYEATERNLLWLQERFKEHLWIIPVLCDTNAQGIALMIKTLYEKYGLANYSLGIYEHRYSAQDLFSVNVDHLSMFLKSLQSFSFHKAPVRLVLKFLREEKRFSDFFMLPDDKQVVTHENRDLGNGVFLELYRENLPIGFWRSVRISPSGYWVGAEDTLNHLRYSKHAPISLRDVDFDTRKAYELGLKSGRAKALGIYFGFFHNK